MPVNQDLTPRPAESVSDLPPPDLWRDGKNIKGYTPDPGKGPWYSAETVRAILALAGTQAAAEPGRADYELAKHGIHPSEAAAEPDIVVTDTGQAWSYATNKEVEGTYYKEVAKPPEAAAVEPAAQSERERLITELTAQASWVPSGPAGVMHRAASFLAAQPPASQAEPAKVEREKLIDLIAEHLSGTYHCRRVWEAWGVGTMSEDDFSDVGESDTPTELADAILAIAGTQAAAEPDTETMVAEVAAALEVVRARHIVEKVQSLDIGGKDADMPTQFQAGYQLACEEILTRIGGAQAAAEPRYETAGYALARRVLQSDLYAKLDDRERAECDGLITKGQAA